MSGREGLHRRSIRLPGYDYSLPGGYFLTLCTQRRECLFGEVTGDQVSLSEYGRIVQQEWDRSMEMRREIVPDTFLIMPNHVHVIVFIHGADTVVGATGRSPLRENGRSPLPGNVPPNERVRPHGPAPRSLSSLVAGFKAGSAKRINEQRGLPGVSVWQRDYYDHIIRNHAELQRIRAYIALNPARWSGDQENQRIGEEAGGPVSRPIAPQD